MNMAVVGQQRSQVGQDSQHILCVQVVEETVRQYEIESLPRRGTIVADVRNYEISLVPSTRTFDIALVEINTEIVDLKKMSRVCARTASHIEHTTHTAQIVVRENRGELLFRKRGLPQPVHGTVIECALH